MKTIPGSGVAMARGRRYGSSRQERFLGTSCYGYGQDQATTDADLSELGEEDVWSMVRHGDDRDFRGGRTGPGNGGDFGSNRASGRWVERGEEGERQVGGLSLAFDEAAGKGTPRIIHQLRAPENKGAHVAASAPVSIPNWSKILRADSSESLRDGYGYGYGDSVEEEDEEGERMPPHEYLAREYAQSQRAAATSVFEGVGRTLKGRDMSRVRDAVWSRTESSLARESHPITSVARSIQTWPWTLGYLVIQHPKRFKITKVVTNSNGIDNQMDPTPVLETVKDNAIDRRGILVGQGTRTFHGYSDKLKMESHCQGYGPASRSPMPLAPSLFLPSEQKRTDDETARPAMESSDLSFWVMMITGTEWNPSGKFKENGKLGRACSTAVAALFGQAEGQTERVFREDKLNHV
ncbi:hypothetical protein H6P81_006948 [Aristolochia fimbriata]|uniref:Uncharacterized protein n=1 Tax=Aristolochia fimbriata TaxID=158543 RepID=A0AAV7F033_ARIFI|nr:hypothetical protein H6P81_006948 [Aristolochia fimbriata]